MTWMVDICEPSGAYISVTRAISSLPIDDSLDALSSSIFFSNLGLVSGFWQLPRDQDVKEKQVFKP